MLITELKSTDAIRAGLRGKVFLLVCHGCREVSFPTAEAKLLEQSLADEGILTGCLTTDYICNGESFKPDIPENTDTMLVLSCGVGVQTVANALPGKRVVAGCDTYPLPGYQGVTPLEHDCDRCGQCYLNLTGGICPLTACSKSLINGQCGGAKNGKCEVDPSMECGWERITKRLAQIGRTDALKCPVQLRDYSK